MTNVRLRIKKHAVLLVIAGAWLAAACGNGAIKPVEILPEDMCLHCRMAISERRCAAEFIDREGKAFKFDDLACMANYIRERQKRTDISAFFVADYGRSGWIKAEEAFYVHASKFNTPMRGGVVAFRDKRAAEAAAAKYEGEVRRFGEVIP